MRTIYAALILAALANTALAEDEYTQDAYLEELQAELDDIKVEQRELLEELKALRQDVRQDCDGRIDPQSGIAGDC